MTSNSENQKLVEIVIDKPLGTIEEEYKDPFHEINAGYTKYGYGQKSKIMRAYVLGVNAPIETFTGKVVAYLENDKETKLIVTPLSAAFTKREIERKLLFAENFGRYEITMCQ